MSKDELKATVFSIPKMDCTSEEQVIRMALESLKDKKKLIFDLSKRRLTAIHHGEPTAAAAYTTKNDFAQRTIHFRAFSSHTPDTDL